MAQMSMNKAIHGAFRRDLQRFVSALEAFSPGDAARAGQLSRAWDQFEDQLHYHHTGEHETAWPALRAVGVPAELIASFDGEHEAMAAAIAEAQAAFGTFARDPSQGRASAALAAVRALQDVTTRHLDHEEAELEPVYQQHRDAPAIKAMGKEFGKVSPARGGRFFAWLTDGASPDEVDAIKASVPGPVIMILTGVFGRDYRRNIAPVWKG